MILLKNTDETIELVTSSTAGIDFSVSWVDVTTTTFTPSTTEGKITTATTTTITAAPAASTQRQIKLVSFRNIHASDSNTISVNKDTSGTKYKLTPEIILLAGECLLYIDSDGWIYYSATGEVKGGGAGAPLASPAFTAVPTAPTAALGTDTTQLATTAFVATAILNTKKGSFGITIDGQGNPVLTGVRGFVSIPYAGTITGWDIFSDITGSIVVDVWKDVYGNFPPTVADTITGVGQKPTLSSARNNQNNSLSWITTAVTAGDVIAFNVDSASVLTRVNLIIKILKT